MAHAMAYLDETVRRAVSIQLKNPEQFVDLQRTRKTRVAGIEVFDEDPVADRTLKLESFLLDAQALKAKLGEASITHIAILPTTAWNAVADDAGLFRFRPDDSGVVIASSDVVNTVAADAANAVARRPLHAFGISALVCGVAALAVTASLGYPAWGIGLTTVLSALAGGYVGGRTVESQYFQEGKAIPSQLAAVEQSFFDRLLSTPREQLLKALWPSREAPENGIRLVIGLPPAPHDAQQNLLRARQAGFELTLDVVGEAIELPNNLASQLADTRAAHWANEEVKFDRHLVETAARKERERAERAARRSDPIVTTTFGSATAIIVQYGDFPLERAVVDGIVNSSRLV